MTERLLYQPTNPTDHTDIPTPPEFKGIMSYNPWHDIQDFLHLQSIKNGSTQESYIAQQAQTIMRKQRDLEKLLGERFAVKRSQINYFVESGRLMSPDYPEPVIERWQKGQKYLKEQGSTESEREEAEVAGATKLQEILAKRKLKPGEKVVIISAQGPEGSLYTENFFDVYEQKGSQIEMSRYHSTHSYQGFLDAAATADPQFETPKSQQLDAAIFLEQPIITTLTIDQILETFKIDVNTQSEKLNEEIVKACMPYILYYIKQLIDNPLALDEIKKRFNTILNIADETEKALKIRSQAEILSKNTENYYRTKPQPTPYINLQQNVERLGTQPVKIVNRGCPGSQKGFSVSQPASLLRTASAISAESVLDFGQLKDVKDDVEDEDTSDFPCPRCGHIITYGAGIKECPGCGLEATCA